MTDFIIFAAVAVIFGVWSVFAYRLGLGDGMRKESGVPPKIWPSKKYKPTKAEIEQQKISEAVENFK